PSEPTTPQVEHFSNDERKCDPFEPTETTKNTCSRSSSPQRNTMTDLSKDCILCADEMSLKNNFFYNVSEDDIIEFHNTDGSKRYEPANSALVLMAGGIYVNWKQPLAYFFVNESCPVQDLRNIVFGCIEKWQ
ncbi:hypothetical protein ILUMI_19100, partial [Ignelater luminosus]